VGGLDADEAGGSHEKGDHHSGDFVYFGPS